MATPLTLNTDRGLDGSARVTATGEIDLSNVGMFTRALASVGVVDSQPLTIDLSAVKYLDSAGINVLFDHADLIQNLRVIVHPLLIRVLTISGLTELATVEAAAGPDVKDGSRL